jgi:hypothetical protein
MEEMTVIPSGHRTKNSRNVAVYEAERLYQVAAGKAAEKGMTLAFTKASYKALIQACFKLLDETHGHKLRREGPQVQSTVVSRAAAE